MINIIRSIKHIQNSDRLTAKNLLPSVMSEYRVLPAKKKKLYKEVNQEICRLLNAVSSDYEWELYQADLLTRKGGEND